MVVDVIMPSLTNSFTKKMIVECINSLRESEKAIRFNVIIIESKDTSIEVGADKIIPYGDSEFCYNKALNMGLRESSNEWVVLANNDLLFSKSWFTNILKAAVKNPEIKSFSPWNRLYDWHKTIMGSSRTDVIEGYRIGHELTGWCIICKREIFSQIELSERVNFWYSDNVYADALIEANIKHALVTRSYVDHLVSKTKVVSQMESILSYQQYMTSKLREV